MNRLLQDLRYAVRQLLKNPGFTVVAVATLALGLGANSAIFSVIDAVLLRPLPFVSPSRLVVVKPTEVGRHDDTEVSYPVFRDWRAQNHVFEGLSAFHQGDFTLTGRGQAAHLTGEVVSANLFSVLGVAKQRRLADYFEPQLVAKPLWLGSENRWPGGHAGWSGIFRGGGDACGLSISGAAKSSGVLDADCN